MSFVCFFNSAIPAILPILGMKISAKILFNQMSKNLFIINNLLASHSLNHLIINFVKFALKDEYKDMCD